MDAILPDAVLRVAGSLKRQNSVGLNLLTPANAAVFYGVVERDAILGVDWAETARQLGEVVPAGLGLAAALTGILNAQFALQRLEGAHPSSFSSAGPTCCRAGSIHDACVA